MKRLEDNPKLLKKMNEQLNTLESIIRNMEEKRGLIFLQWLDSQNKYLNWELTFDPKKLRKYNRSEIVLVNFGFNPGSEIGGLHYAVVMDDNDKTNPIVNVVPLGSLDQGETKNMLHKDEVYLGVIPGLNEKEAYAIPNQLLAVSKLRIYTPRKADDSVYSLSSDQMNKIDLKILSLFTKVLGRRADMLYGREIAVSNENNE